MDKVSEFIPSVKRVTSLELKELLDSGKEVVVIDVRATDSYGGSSEKIKGALRIPGGDLEARLSELDKAKQVLAYCT
ncbi:MAG: hypothetical protein KAT46_04525 [Deltaproteobacteria bacterium]|nr:hypothetical protein [Deltaproteobacteria bacterium]